ncbi:MAG TPA: hypothetical protein VFP25_00765 [Nitrososphaeraceae archaeon]|nr:hypothetical protein [Nitrososphaeraceae archaeon]
MSEVQHNIVFDKNSNPFLMNGHTTNTPKVAQFNLSTNNLQSMVPKYKNVFGQNNKAKVPRLKAPYRKRDLDRFEDCIRSDGTVRLGVSKKWNFILGAHIAASLDVNKEFQNDDERANALNAVMSYEPYIKARDKANEILRRTNFRKVIHSAGVQASTYGRSCVEKVKDPSTNRLVRLNILNSKLLGDVEVDPNTWEFLGVHYRDLPKNEDLLEKENIIYLTRNDHHISPGSMYYGLSDLEPVIDGSETKRIIKQEDLKEIARALWAGFGWLLFKDPNISHTQMEAIVNTMKAGGWFATDQNVELKVQEIAQNAPMLLDIINEMNLETARDLAIPSPLVGYENKQNYSNLVQTLISWKESDLDAERRWLTALIEEQLLDEIFRNELQIQGIELPEQFGLDDEEGTLMVQKPMIVPNEQPLNPLQPNDMMMNQTQFIPPAKLSIDIEDPNFETAEKRVANALQLFSQDLISARKVLQEAEMEDQIEETEMRLAEKQAKLEQMQQFQQNVFQTEVQRSDLVNNKRMNLLNKLESKLGKVVDNSNINTTTA